MTGAPFAHPRDQLIDKLSQQLDAFFGTSKKVEPFAPGVFSKSGAIFGN
ncbi:hypothetical protein [Pseudomonas grimontii]|nr:hypothetical protein [Pseudomonas grimontii]MCS3512558.1 hypothetical protein [Pseudomonas grimontii]